MENTMESNSSSSNKKIVVKNSDTEQKILTQYLRPNPEFKDKVAIIGVDGVLLKSEKVFVCPEPGCGALFALEKTLNYHILIGHLDRHIKCSFCGSTFKSTEEKETHVTSFHPNLEENPDGNPLECLKCRQVCSSPNKLNRHIRRCHPNETFFCPHCNREFRWKEAMQDHVKFKHPPEGKEVFPCEVCNKPFYRAGERRRHMKDAHRSNDKRYRCVICDTIYYNRKVYFNHLKIHTTGKAFTCDICNTSYRTKAKLKRHEDETLRHKQLLRKKNRVRRKPEVDSKDFNTSLDLEVEGDNPKKSLKELRGMGKEELYDFCWQRVPKVILFKLQPMNRSMSSATREEGDLRNLPLDEDDRHVFDLKCVDCKEEFEDKETLDAHERICQVGREHVRRGPQTCEICGKVFKKNYSLVKHYSVHSDARPFKCNYCDSTFKSKVTQMVHEKHVHFGVPHKKSERVFTCNYTDCGKTYTTEKSLKKHVRIIHLGVRLKCEEPGCGKAFKTQCALKIHRELKHAENPVLIECKPCMKTFKHRVHYIAHSRKPRHIWKMKNFRDWEEGEKEKQEALENE